ncbi:probable transcription factor At5g28040 [Olea europaea subsp. europaea]|uniref:Probable transcription factor At5g28040 n=1 Tax=Olea europaea subsp. europaea TaxID=158383 RepID=A0A8S0UUW1_OLEEU|nr:probable transcription factor At5g28040 [Olea europaea subsp. europaea]
MDFTPIPRIQLKPSSSKLPIKRKNPDPAPHLNANPFKPNSPCGGDGDPRSPPFKFHRIWTEPDEIRFLQGLLDCSSENLTFPRDLGIFYTRFSNTMSQPYTKSQLSEKLRRLRKKFRVISTRLSKGLDKSQLSPQDRMLYELSKQLWHPDYAATSPFSGTRNVNTHNNHNNSNNDDGDYGGVGGCSDELVKKSGLVAVKVDFLPTFPINLVKESGVDNENENEEDGVACGDFYHDDNNEDQKLSEVKVNFEGSEGMGDGRNGTFDMGFKEEEPVVGQNVDLESGIHTGFGQVAAKVVLNVFNDCLKEVKSGLIGHGSERANVDQDSFEERWQKQRIAELDVLGHRLRLVLEHSMQ